MKKILCKLFGHKWVAKWYRHNHYFGLTCVRCGYKPTKKDKQNLYASEKLKVMKKELKDILG